MKSHPVNAFPKEVEDKIHEQLSAAFVRGASYGAIAFCSVVKDKIDKFTGNDQSELIADIQNFVDTTMKNSPEQIAEAFKETNNRANQMLGKDN